MGGGKGRVNPPQKTVLETSTGSTDFRMHFGSLLGPTLDTFCDFSMILGAKVGDSFQVHVFGDPGMEMMPECCGCMCLNHSKNCRF